MNKLRKETLINEILFWKEHNMLPGNYCDFLLAHYQDEETILDENMNKSQHVKWHWKQIFPYFFAVLMFPLSFVIIYFTEFSFVLQTLILTLFIIISFLLGRYYTKKEVWHPIFYIMGTMIVLLLSIHINAVLFQNEPIRLYTTLFLNCGLWLLLGRVFSLIFFSISGVLGILILIGALIF
ncbi:hypothetical protein [Bacillus chungangensis]|uniref:Cation transport ATPase n=1 Tax=Bacillus chungangensis TaxID=587633 RepID=A0ABT9WPW5_9BACI|nr:hypothetical protein [Bacillus chungangensis]MDQ0175216.1 cation transport ATPase [Bacillus chungangensis]